MYPILFSIGNVNFYTHGLLIAIGSLVGGLVIFYIAKKEQLTTNFLFDLLIFSLFAGVIGARITYVILYYYQVRNWHDMFLIWYGGLVSFGGIIAGFLVAGLILKNKKQNILRWFDIGIIGLLLGWAFGRIGCLLSGDVLGITSVARIAIWGRVPVTLFESIWSVILAGSLFLLLRYRHKLLQNWGNGIIFYLGLGGYALGRFVIDFFREESVLYILKSGQITSLILLIIIIFIIAYRYFRRSNA